MIRINCSKCTDGKVLEVWVDNYPNAGYLGSRKLDVSDDICDVCDGSGEVDIQDDPQFNIMMHKIWKYRKTTAAIYDKAGEAENIEQMLECAASLEAMAGEMQQAAQALNDSVKEQAQ